MFRGPWQLLLQVLLVTAAWFAACVACACRGEIKPDPALDLEQRKASHWCWRPGHGGTPPAVCQSAWPDQTIDRYILHRLEEHGIQPAAAADRRTLIRRVYFDLVGLPPTPDQAREFLGDESPEALARVVDSLLAAPQFGERWARHWLDLVRYAETYGHEFDHAVPHAWQYRDYVIRALNGDVPYDQLVREHIAGDLLREPRMNPEGAFNESIIGTGFWWLGEALHAPTDVRADQVERVDNQIDVMTKAFLALTVSCARCHDHKFDAISMEDYYALAGYLRSSRRHVALLDPGGEIAAAGVKADRVRMQASWSMAAAFGSSSALVADELARSLRAALEACTSAPESHQEIAARFGIQPAVLARWLAALTDPETAKVEHPLYAWASLLRAPGNTTLAAFAERRREWAQQQLDLAAKAADFAQRSVLFEDFSQSTYDGWFASGEAFGRAPTQPGEWDAVAGGCRLEAAGLAHSALGGSRLRGALRSPTFTITHPRIHYRLATTATARVRLVIEGYFMNEFQQLLFNNTLVDVDTGGRFIWSEQAGDLRKYIGHRAYIECIDHGDGYIAVDQIRFSNEAAADPPRASPLLEMILADSTIDSPERLANAYGRLCRDALDNWRGRSLDAAHHELIRWLLAHELVPFDDSIAGTLRQALHELERLNRTLPEPLEVLAICNGSGEDVGVHERGDYRTLGPVAMRRAPWALCGNRQTPAPAVGSGRLELAERLLESDTPLIPRVMVNRVWHYLLGRGIVPTVDNFGALGQPPTHPELLDHLAATFVQEGWSVKKLIRRIVLSKTYQMASHPIAADQQDPENRLWHRANLRRLEGEAIRDAALAASGHLDRVMFGRSVPIHLTPFMEGRGRPDTSGPLDGAGRRSVYVEVRRNFLSPWMLAFDTPIPFNCVGRRSVSNVPAQALLLMNDPLMVELAGHWVPRIFEPRDLSTAGRIQEMFETAFSRVPSADELAAAQAFLDRQATLYRLPADASNNDPRVWTDLCHVLFNVKDFVYLH
jgi:hypothetical protein